MTAHGPERDTAFLDYYRCAPEHAALGTLPGVSAQSGDFRFGMDGSPKVADVKVDGNWRTYLVVGQGSGGTFYQTFDVTLDDIDNTVAPDSDNMSAVLSYFSSASSVPLKWAFPSYQHFDVSLGQWGDIAAAAPQISKTVGETWSDPAVEETVQKK